MSLSHTGTKTNVNKEKHGFREGGKKKDQPNTAKTTSFFPGEIFPFEELKGEPEAVQQHSAGGKNTK